jgi:hypothetical protein
MIKLQTMFQIAADINVRTIRDYVIEVTGSG